MAVFQSFAGSILSPFAPAARTTMRPHAVLRWIAVCLLCSTPTVMLSPAAPALQDGQKFKHRSARCETPSGAAQQRCDSFQPLGTK